MTNNDLAALCRDAVKPSRVIDGLVFKARHEQPGDDWHEWDEDEGGVWHRRDREDHAAFDPPAPVSTSLDAALAERAPGMRLASLREHLRCDGADESWRPWGATIEIGHLFSAEGTGATAALAVLSAIFAALARAEAQ